MLERSRNDHIFLGMLTNKKTLVTVKEWERIKNVTTFISLVLFQVWNFNSYFLSSL